MLHPTMIMLLLAVMVGTFVVILYSQYTSETGMDDDTRQGSINNTTSETISALQAQVSAITSNLPDISSQVSSLETVANGLSRATTKGLASNQAGTTLNSVVYFNAVFNTTTPCVTYDSNTGTFTMEPNSVYLVCISLLTDLWPSSSLDSGDSRWATFYTVDGNGSAFGPKLIAQPVTRNDPSDVNTIRSFTVNVGAEGSASTFLSVKCIHIGNTGYSFAIRPESRITFIKLGQAS